MTHIPLSSGIVTALVTPFHEDLSLDLEALEALVERQIASGVAAVCALGGTGEPLSLTQDERKEVIRTAFHAAAGRVPVIAGDLVGSADEVFDLAAWSGRLGADALMIMPPSFIMPTLSHITRYFADISSRANVPLVVFNTPARSGINLSPAPLGEMISAVPNVVAVKEASGDSRQADALISAFGDSVKVYQGHEDLLLQTTAAGGAGGFLTLGCLFPNDYVELHAAAARGDLERARALHAALQPMLPVLYGEPNPGPTKYAMALRGVPGGGPTRPPIYPVSQKTRQAVEVLLRTRDRERAATVS